MGVKIKSAILTAVIIMLVAVTSVLAQGSEADRLKDEMGMKRLQVIYPESGSTVEENNPMIAIGASQLETPMDPKTVVIMLDGAEVTESAEVTPAYIVYQPLTPLTAGMHEVYVTAKDVNKNSIEALGWNFYVGGAQAAVSAVAEEAEKDNTTGRLEVSYDYVAADYEEQSAIDVSDLFREKEGSKLNADLSFNNISEGRTIIGSYHRETQYYSDIEIDKARMNYYDDNFEATAGNFWFRTSDLTVTGTELAGLMIDKEVGNWDLKAFSGRSQDPSTSGTFKQVTSGIETAYNWSKDNRTSVVMLMADEQDDAVFGLNSDPAKDRIVSVRHENKFKGFNTNLELARNYRRSGNEAYTHNEAAKLDMSGKIGRASGKASVYRIGDGFLPVAEGSAKFLKSNRHGYLMNGNYMLTQMINFGGEYEQYDEFDKEAGENPIKRGNAYVNIGLTQRARMSYRKAKLTRTGTVSESDAVNATFTLPSTNIFAETRITVGWQDIDYNTSLVQSNTEVWVGSLNTAYKDILTVSLSHSLSETEDAINATGTDNKNTMLGLSWNIIPFKLMWMGSYQMMDNSGNNVDNEEERAKATVKYVLNDVYTLNMGLEWVDYSDEISSATSYEQGISRLGVEVRF